MELFWYNNKRVFKMEGIYLIDKPEGISSYDCIRKLKKALDFKKIGHSGTLDPFASGLLIVLVGRATKLSSIFLEEDKEYIGAIYFGKATNTYDSTGETTSEVTDFKLDELMIDQVFKDFTGTILQKPPIFSAVRHQGKRLYEYARKKEEVNIKERIAHIKQFVRTTPVSNNQVEFYSLVSKGTYLRSLAYDVGQKLEIPTHLASLRRVKSGMFSVLEAYKIEEVVPGIKPSLTIEEYAVNLEKLVVKPYLERYILNGIQLDARQTITKNIFAVYNEEDKLLAIYRPVKDKYNPFIILGD